MASVRRRTAATWWSGAVHVPSSAPRARRRAMVDIQGQDLTRPDGTGPQQGCVSVTIVRANPAIVRLYHQLLLYHIPKAHRLDMIIKQHTIIHAIIHEANNRNKLE